jgi:lysophospholipid acyltransferase (LPLAT)-like uncharacterized protein
VSEAEPSPLSLWFRRALGAGLLGPYLRFVQATSTLVYDPPDFWSTVEVNWPVIISSWHGQSNLGYAAFPHPSRFAIMASTHPDGQIAAGLAGSFGFKVIAGSGASERQRHGTGAVGAFRQTLRSLADGFSTIATGDVPPIPGRQLSPGLIAMAARSGRPIFTIAIASSRRRVLHGVWDKMLFPLPFSRIGFAAEGPFYVSGDLDADGAALKASLDRVLARAFEIADAKARGPTRQ